MSGPVHPTEPHSVSLERDLRPEGSHTPRVISEMRTPHATYILRLLILVSMLVLPAQAFGASAEANENQTLESENKGVRERDPWTISVSTNLLLNGYRVSNRMGDGRMEASVFLGMALSDFELCLMGPCDNEGSDFAPALGFGLRRYYSPSRFTGYVGTNLYVLPHGIIIAEKTMVLPSVSAGLYWQGHSGFTFAMGAEVYMFSKSEGENNSHLPGLGKLATVPWFTMEIGWSF